MSRTPLIRDRDTALYLGLAAYLLGAVLLWDAFENRGKGKPLWAKFLPAA